METHDIVDDVNALLKLGVGDAYRLEHIKQSYIDNKTIWITDNNYLQQMIGKYLTKHQFDEQKDDGEKSEDITEDKDMVHCWKCGKKGPLGANFCMVCGSSIFEVGAESQPAEVQAPLGHKKNPTKTIGLKIPIIIGIPILILIILGAGYTQGYFDNALEMQAIEEPVEKVEPKDSTSEPVAGETDSKCGPGTVFDIETNSCVLT